MEERHEMCEFGGQGTELPCPLWVSPPPNTRCGHQPGSSLDPII